MTISSADAASKTDNSSSALEKGTVRYVGEVAGTKGEWIGVEWDDEGRGRHDGSHDGKRSVELNGTEATCVCQYIQGDQAAWTKPPVDIDVRKLRFSIKNLLVKRSFKSMSTGGFLRAAWSPCTIFSRSFLEYCQVKC